MRPNIRVIEIFVRVVESGSFVAAARSLLIDPAAVSRAIKSLEENLGIPLFTAIHARAEANDRRRALSIGTPPRC